MNSSNTRKNKPETSVCGTCGAVIWWGKTSNGKPAPFNVKDGQPTDVSHFTTCPQARSWSHK